MAKFKAGDFITAQVDVTYEVSKVDEYGDFYVEEVTEKEWRVYLVNRIVGDCYSLDNGKGFIDGRQRIAEIDATFEKCD